MTFNYIPEPLEKGTPSSSKYPVDKRLRKMAEIEAALIESDIKENGFRFQKEKQSREILSGKRKPGL